jgi:hypothetical protein
MAAAKAAPQALTRVRVKEGATVYTGFGHAPFKAGRVISLPQSHATALIAGGHVESPEVAAARAAASAGAEAKATAANTAAPAAQDAPPQPKAPPAPAVAEAAPKVAPPTIGPATTAAPEAEPVRA